VVRTGFHPFAMSLINLIIGWVGHLVRMVYTVLVAHYGFLWLTHKRTFSTHVISLESLQGHKNITRS
jgi:hypothetical protein